MPSTYYLRAACPEPFSDVALVATTSAKLAPQLPESAFSHYPGASEDTLDIGKALGLSMSRFPVEQV